jgi:hypothetical protein
MQKEKKRPLARSHPSIHPSLRGRILGAAPQATPHVAAAPAAAPSRALRAHARNNAAADRAYRLWPSSASRPAERQSGRALYVRMYPCGVHTTTGAARVGVGAACACTSSQGSPSPCAVVDRALDPRGNQRVLWPGRTSATARTSSLSATARRRRPRQQPDDGAPGRYSSRASTLSRTAARGTGGASAVQPCGVACPRRPLTLGGDGRVSGTDVPEPAA